MKSKQSIPCLAVVLAIVLLLLAPLFGSTFIAPSALWDDSMDGLILRNMRLPRVIMAFLAGGLLAYGGTCFQALFRNNLTSPYTLGISGGAALGVSLIASTDIAIAISSIGATCIGAFLGAASISAIVYAISRFSKEQHSNGLLLTGVAISFFTSSAIMFFQYTAREAEIIRVLRWMSGSISNANYCRAAILLPLWIAALLSPLSNIGSKLDLLSLGEDFASSHGINIPRSRLLLFTFISITSGAVVALCGPIGFVGLLCPHICRCLIGSPNQRLLPFSMIFGGIFLIICDTLGRSLFNNADIPAGLITSLLGAPFFIYLLIKKQR